MDSVVDLTHYRSFVLLGCGYPESIGHNKPGRDILVRMGFLKCFGPKLKDTGRIPNYGDYTIVHPEFTPRDMRMIKSGGKIVYTSDGHWTVRKGGAFRDDPAQMHNHCAYILSSGKFRGSAFSNGDFISSDVRNEWSGRQAQPDGRKSVSTTISCMCWTISPGLALEHELADSSGQLSDGHVGREICIKLLSGLS